MRRLRSLPSLACRIVAAVVALAGRRRRHRQCRRRRSHARRRRRSRPAVHDAATRPRLARHQRAHPRSRTALLPSGLAARAAGSPAADRRRRPAVDGRRRPPAARAPVRRRRRADRLRRQRRFSVYDAPSKTVYRVRCRRSGTQPTAGTGRPTLDDVPRRSTGLAADVDPVRRAADLDRRAAELHRAHRAEGRRRPAGRRRARVGRRPRRAAARGGLRPGPARARCSSSRRPTISYGPVPAADVEVKAPAGAKVVELARRPAMTRRAARRRVRAPPPSSGSSASRCPRRPRSPGCRARRSALVRFGDENGALATYGQGLGGIFVLQRKADAAGRRARLAVRAPADQHRRRDRHASSRPRSGRS